MSVLTQALTDFGRDIGIDHLQERPEGGVQLRLENGDVLGVQQQAEEVLVHYAHACSFDAPSRLLRAMKLSHAVTSDAAMVQVGLRETPQACWLVLAQRVPAMGFNARQMHQVLGYLQECLHQTAA